MKDLKKILMVLIILLVSGYCLSHHLYDKKYDDYYNRVVAEYIEASSNDRTLKMKVHITADQIEYHHLGKDITKEYTCNNKMINDGEIIPYSSKLDFVATITEHDSIDDVGTGKVTMLGPLNNNKVTATVRVDEDGGRRYADAYAIWEVTFIVEPIVEDLKIGFWDVVFSSH